MSQMHNYRIKSEIHPRLYKFVMCKNIVLILGAYALFSRKTYFKMLKNLGKNIWMYIATYYAKNTKMCREKAYFSTEFCHFHTGHIKSCFFSKLLCEHVEHGDVHIKF
jgi:hypothetical protein